MNNPGHRNFPVRRAAEIEQRSVAGHENVSISSLCQKQERLVVRIAANGQTGLITAA